MRPAIGGEKAVLNPQSYFLDPQSSVISPQKCLLGANVARISTYARAHFDEDKIQSGFEDSPQLVPACSEVRLGLEDKHS